MASRDLERFFALLPTSEYQRGIALFDQLVKDPSNAGPILLELAKVASAHDDPQLRSPHGLLTVQSGRDLLRLTRPPAGLPLLRYLVLYNFTLRKRPLTLAQAEAAARSIPQGPLPEMAAAYRKAVSGSLGGKAAALLGRIALDHGFEAAAHVALRSSLDDLGRLGHNLILATAYVEVAGALGPPAGLLPLMHLAHLQGFALAGTPPVVVPPREGPGEGEPDVDLLDQLLEEEAFDRIEAVLQALAFEGQAEEAYRPLLIAASADSGFLGHTLSLVHSARLASRYLTPSENTFLSWKLYRTLTSRFGYPEFLRLGEPTVVDQEAILAALEASLRFRSPPAETTVRQALEAGIPLEAILAKVVDAYGYWTVGEKEHTIAYLNAALQTAKFLGREQALLPLAMALSKLPF